jgi:phosphopantetheine--protein transferase-like protein
MVGPQKTVVALATVDDLPATARGRPDAERRASRVAARRAIRGVVGSSAEVEIRARPSRPPVVRVCGDSRGAAPALSLTHRDGKAAAIAAPAGTRVGIDIERLDDIDSDHARRFLTAREQRAAQGFSLAVLWSLKEAFWKAMGLDGSVAFHDLELDVDAAGRVRGVCYRDEWRRAAATIAAPWPRYVMAAVCVESAR